MAVYNVQGALCGSLALLALLGVLCGSPALLGALCGSPDLLALLGALCGSLDLLALLGGFLVLSGPFRAFGLQPRLHHFAVTSGEGVARLIHTALVQDRPLCGQCFHV